MQRGLADVLKENFLEDLELEEVEFELVVKFLKKLKKEFSKRNKELIKVAKLKKIK